MAHYRLYLDESETRNASGSSFFVVGGVILNASSEVAVAQELNALKLSLWAGVRRASLWHTLFDVPMAKCYTQYFLRIAAEKGIADV